MPSPSVSPIVVLPPARHTGGAPLAAAIAARRSVREFAPGALSLADVGQLAWAAAGVTARDGRRAAPSGGGLYPLELHLAAGAVEGLAPGLWRYRPTVHALEPGPAGDAREALAAAALGQDCVRAAPACFALTVLWSRSAERYGDRGRRYALLEAGHAAQNLLLQATALGLGAAPIGAFEDAATRAALGLPPGEDPIYLLPVGCR